MRQDTKVKIPMKTPLSRATPTNEDPRVHPDNPNEAKRQELDFGRSESRLFASSS
ncbi:unnamed protein product [Tenebrio molitor]|nr:unnamed protein product [Tenebrio molitor]